MEKLLNLLNEYEEKRIKKINADWKLPVKLLFKPYTKEVLTNQAYRSCWLEICSKYYSFIKRLVENDKINNRNLNLQVFMSIFSNDGTVEISYEELILMLLAISDEPLELLISILK